VGPGELGALLAPLLRGRPPDERVLVGAESGDDAGVFALDGRGLVATIDFIPPLCDDPRRFGRIAATNALSDVWAMGGEPLFALNVCAFPDALPPGDAAEILRGGLDALDAAGAALLGGHSIRDPELKYGMAVIGAVDPGRVLSSAGAGAGQSLVLTKPLGAGVFVNAFRAGRISAGELEPVLVEMERPNRAASRLAIEHGATSATDVTGFGLAGHAWNLARESDVTLELEFDWLESHDGFFELAAGGVSTGCTPKNRAHLAGRLERARDLTPPQEELLFDPQTSGGLLVALPTASAGGYLAALRAAGHRASVVGRLVEGGPRVVVR
jgi:selenide,water dikinase